MLKRTVPTPAWKPSGPATWTGGLAVASMANTSLSGSVNLSLASQLRPSSSTQLVPSCCTIRLTSGWSTPRKSVVGGGKPMPSGALGPPLVTIRSCTVAVRLPEWNAAAYTVLPSGLTARARGVSANRVTMVSGSPSAQSSASKTQTSARPTPGVSG